MGVAIIVCTHGVGVAVTVRTHEGDVTVTVRTHDMGVAVTIIIIIVKWVWQSLYSEVGVAVTV